MKLCLLYLKLGIDFPLESLVSSISPAFKRVPVFGSSTVADFSVKVSFSTKSLGFKELGESPASYKMIFDADLRLQSTGIYIKSTCTHILYITHRPMESTFTSSFSD